MVVYGVDRNSVYIFRDAVKRGRINRKGTHVTSRPNVTVSSLSLSRGVVGNSGVLQCRQFVNVVPYARHNL